MPTAAAPAVKPKFFASPAAFRSWLDRHHAAERELWVGFYKVKSGRTGMVYRQALDEALCYGWIDGMVRRLDEDRYVQRFTPRQKVSTWSLVNIRRVKELISEGRMHAAGLAAFEGRDEKKAGLYSFEQGNARLPPAFARQLKANPAARAFFDAQPPGYRRLAAWWVVSAKKEETRARRFAVLLGESAAGRRIGTMAPGRQEG
jgi:uncharacterized protein YdeI (YjbR/CyaY-like superfamily)